MTDKEMKRYDLTLVGVGFHASEKMIPAIDGDWVRADEAIARIAELEEAVRVLTKHMATREKHETGPTVHTLHALNVACVDVEENLIARAAVEKVRNP